MEANGLDHDDGIDGVTTEKSSVLRRKGQFLGGMPVFASAQMQKDKNQATFQVTAACAQRCLRVTSGTGFRLSTPWFSDAAERHVLCCCC